MYLRFFKMQLKLFVENGLPLFVFSPLPVEVLRDGADDFAISIFKRGDVAPYGGYAFYHTAMRGGQQVHIGHFFPKVRAARGAKTYNTRGKTIEFGTI